MAELRSVESVEANDELYSLSCGPDYRVHCYPGCVINGVRYLIKSRDDQHTTQNSGVMVPGDHDNNEIAFYGVIISIIELVYVFGHRVILFKCKWFDTDEKKKRLQKSYHLTSINVAHTWYEDDPFILAVQAQQVFYINDTLLGPNWRIVEVVQHRGLWDSQEKEATDKEELEIFQQNDSSETTLLVQQDDLEQRLFHRRDIEAEFIQTRLMHNDSANVEEDMGTFEGDQRDETIYDYSTDSEAEMENDSNDDEDETEMESEDSNDEQDDV